MNKINMIGIGIVIAILIGIAVSSMSTAQEGYPFSNANITVIKAVELSQTHMGTDPETATIIRVMNVNFWIKYTNSWRN